MTRSKKLLRPLSYILLQSLIVQQFAFADVLTPSAAKQELQSKPVVGLEFPDSMASIEDAYKNGNDKLIYLIQDAHTNESGQYNLAKALGRILDKENDLKYVFVEAGVGDNSLSSAKPLSELQKVSSEYIRKGLLHGEEYLQLTSDRIFTLWGVEDLGLYQKAVEDYRQVAGEREHFDMYLKKIEATTETLKNRFFNPSLKTFDNERNAYRDEKLPLTGYFTALWREASLQNISLNAYPHLSLLKSLKEKEEKLDFSKANAEHLKAIEGLSKEAQADLRQLTDASQNKADKVLGQGQKETQAYFFALEEKLGAQKSSYPELVEYFDYLKLAKDMEAKEVLSEIDSLEGAILGVLSRSEDEKSLIRCENVLFHLKKLFHFTMTPEEYASYKEETRGFTIEHLTGFLNKKIMDLGTYYDRSLFLEKGYDETLKRAESFYELTRKRDEFFIRTTLEKMDKESAKKAVLITGGFHTANLKALLKEKGISFVSVTPQVWQATNMKKYESLLLNQTLKTSANVSGRASASMARLVPVVTGAQAGNPASLEVLAAVGARLATLKDIRWAIDKRAIVDLTQDQISKLTAEEIKSLTEAQIGVFAKEQISAFTNDQIRTFTPAQIRAFLSSRIRFFTEDQVRAFTELQIRTFTETQIRAFTESQIQAFTNAQIQAFTAAQIRAFTKIQISAFTPDQIQVFTETQITAFTATQISVFTKIQIPAFTKSQIQAFTKAQIKAFTEKQIQAFSDVQIKDLTDTQIKALTFAQIYAFSKSQILAFTVTQIPSFTNAQLRALSETQIRMLTEDQVRSLTKDQIEGLGFSRLMMFSRDQLLILLDQAEKLGVNNGARLAQAVNAQGIKPEADGARLATDVESLQDAAATVAGAVVRGAHHDFVNSDNLMLGLNEESALEDIAKRSGLSLEENRPTIKAAWDAALPAEQQAVMDQADQFIAAAAGARLSLLSELKAALQALSQDPSYITVKGLRQLAYLAFDQLVQDLERDPSSATAEDRKTLDKIAGFVEEDVQAGASKELREAEKHLKAAIQILSTAGARLAGSGDPVAVAQVLSDGAEFLQQATLTPPQIAKKAAETRAFLAEERADGRYIRRLHTAEQIATVRPTVQMTQNITNYTARLFANVARQKHMRNATTIANFGVDSAVMADAVVTSAVPDGKVLRQDFINITDNVDQLFKELVQNGYIDAQGVPQQKFMDLPGATGLTGLGEQFAKNTDEIYLILMDRLYIRIEAIYNGGWAESMREGRSDQAKSPHPYLGKLPAEISVHLIRHAAAQEAALSNLTAEARAKYRPINYFVPLFADGDEGHLKVKEMIGTMLTMGEEESLIGAVHIEDQAHGCKKCGHMSGKVLDGEDQWVRTLNNARFQLDVMGLRTMIVARTDAEAAEWITSTLSGNDQQFLLGVTDFQKSFQKVYDEEMAIARKSGDADVIKAVEAGLASIKKLLQNPADPSRIRPYHEVISDIRALGFEGTDLQRVHEYWMKSAGLVRLEEAVAEAIRNNSGKVKIDEAEWKDFINSIPRSTIYKKVDRLKMMKDKARQIGVNVYTDAEWDILRSTSPESLGTQLSVLWDFDLTKTEENSRTMWMIDTGLQMATSRSIAALPYTDFSWFEQHHPNIGEVKIWAAALDKEAIRLLEEEDFYGLVKRNQNGLKPQILQILGKYLVERPENPEYFLTALKELQGLGLSKEQSISLINAVSRLKANNTSPSFVWPNAMSEKDPSQKMSDEEKRVFLKEQGKYVQFQFATYWGSMMAHIMTTLYTKGGVDPEDLEMMSDILRNGYLRDGMLTVSRLQYLGRKYGSKFAQKSQDYAGTDLQAKRDASANGQATVTAAAGGKGDTMVIGGNTALAPSTAVLAKFGQSLLTDSVLAKLERSRPAISGARLAATIGSNSIPNTKVRDWVNETAKYLGVDPGQIEIVDASDDERLIDEEVEAGNLIRLNDGNFYARSHSQDVARVVSRTMVATANPDDKGVYNNWRDAATIRSEIDTKMKGAVKPGEKVYIIPHLMGPEGSDLSKAVVQVTNSRYVAINMIRMARVGAPAWNTIEKTGEFIRAVHYTGDLDNINRSGKEGEDDRYFVSFPETREIWSFGSAYGGNALLGKKFVSLRQAGWDALKEGWLAEHMFIVELEMLKGPRKGEKYYITGAYPSASGKTNSAMMRVPDALKDLVAIRVVGDDIAWMRQGEDGRLYAVNPEAGFFGVVPGTNDAENPNFMTAIGPNTGTIFTNVAHNTLTDELWWEGKGPKPTDLTGWQNWKGETITEANADQAWAHPNSRATAAGQNAPNLSPSFSDPKGVPISLILFGGRVDDRETLLRVLEGSVEGIVDGASVVVRDSGIATQGGAALGIKPDMMAKDAFYSNPEDRDLQHWLNIFDQLGPNAPAIAHVNWFRKDPATGKFMWPGFGYNLYAFLLALDFDPSDVTTWTKTPVGYVPTANAFYRLGLSEQEVPRETLEKLLEIDRDLWLKEMDRRDAYFKDIEAQLGRPLPAEIWEVNARIRRELEAMPVSGARLSRIEPREDATVGDVVNAYSDILTPQALGILQDLAERFSQHRAGLMELRNALRLSRHQSIPGSEPNFRGEEELILQPDGALTVRDAREGKFRGASVPRDLERQYIQGTGPAGTLRNIAYALLSGADGWMFDGEDALGQIDTMSLDNIRNLKKAIAKDPEFLRVALEIARELDAKGELNRSNASIWDSSLTFEEKVQKQLEFTTKIFRARGLHLDDRHLMLDGQAIPASIVDMVLYLVNNGSELIKNGSTPTLYLPKIQNYEQAALWNEMISAVENEMGWPDGTVRVFVLIEQVDAALQLMEIRAALGKHFVGFNTGRWDYIHSVTDAKIGDPNFVEPDISVITMTYPFMAAYETDVRIAANVPDLDGNTTLWIGGMEPQIPVGTPEAVKLAMERAVAGKERERNAGASGAWVAHWKMVPVVRPVWADNLGGNSNLMQPSSERIAYTDEHLAQLFELRPGDTISTKGIADAISVDLQYVNAYLVGRAAVAIKPASEFPNDMVLFLMEDAATSEIRGGWLWELLHKKAVITDGKFAGRTFDGAIFRELLEDEFQRLVNEPDAKKVFPETKATTLPVAKYILQRYVEAGFKVPWLIDLSNAALQASSITEAMQSVDAYINYLTRNNGRLTRNLRFSPSSSGARLAARLALAASAEPAELPERLRIAAGVRALDAVDNLMPSLKSEGVDAAALELFVLQIHTGVFALLRSDGVPQVLRTAIEEDGALRAYVRLGDIFTPLLRIENPDTRLKELFAERGRTGIQEGTVTAQDILIAEKVTRIGADTVPVKDITVKTAYAIPVSALLTPSLTEFEARLMAAAARHEMRGSEYAFYTDANAQLSDGQHVVLDRITSLNLPHQRSFDGIKKLDGMIIRYVDTTTAGGPEVLANTVNIPITNLPEESAAGWERLISVGFAAASIFAAGYSNGAIDYSKVSAKDVSPELIFFVQDNMQNSSNFTAADLIAAFSAQDWGKMRALAIRLPILAKVSVDVMVDAARMMMTALGQAA